MTQIKWRAAKAKLYAATDASISLDTSTSYKSQFSTANATEYTAYLKDITITPPEMNVELINTLGEDSNGFQNSYEEIKPSTMAKLTATLVMQGDEIFETGLTGTTFTSGYTDYLYNNSKRTNKAYSVLFDDGTDEINCVFKTGYVKLGERKSTGTDGHWEQSIEIVCNPANYREQFKD
jgi:hypothetical protein